MKNPILPGFHPDPCLCRRGDDYYLAVSSFEWFPGIPIYHSRDLKHWELLAHALNHDRLVDLRRLPSAKGIWAPCLTWCEADGLFYMVYGIMNSTNARYFDVNNYVITAPEIEGPWSEPVYLHSAGFDASLFHGPDGRKFLISMDWETRPDYEKPGAICLVECDPETRRPVGIPKRIYTGGTDRGCIEAPHMYWRDDWYYLMCAEGGTGYNHCVTMARARDPWGPYMPDPQNPIVTSNPRENNERMDWDHLKPQYYNPDSLLQKSGHGSLVETALGEVYLAHLCARPFVPELRCTLGRETALQKMCWTEDGWLRMASGSNLALEEFEPSALPEVPVKDVPETDEFDGPDLGQVYYAPRQELRNFASLVDRPGWLRLRGSESLCSLHEVSLAARKLISVCAEITTKLDFQPENYRHSAGLTVFYDNMNYAYLEKSWREETGEVLRIRRLENGERTDLPVKGIPAPEGPVWMRVTIHGRKTQFSWSVDGTRFEKIGPAFDTTTFSDEYCKFGEFTGTFVGMACEDTLYHAKAAYFDFFSYRAVPVPRELWYRCSNA